MSSTSNIINMLERQCPALVKVIGTNLISDALSQLVDFVEARDAAGTTLDEDALTNARTEGFNEGSDDGQNSDNMKAAKAEGFEEGYKLALEKSKAVFLSVEAPAFAQIAKDLDVVMKERFPAPEKQSSGDAK